MSGVLATKPSQMGQRRHRQLPKTLFRKFLSLSTTFIALVACSHLYTVSSWRNRRLRAGLGKAVPIFSFNNPPQVTWSPSIVRLPNGALLVAFETAFKSKVNVSPAVYLYSSTNEGKAWRHVSSLAGLRSPQLFVCKSGVYMFFLRTLFEMPSDLFIVKMLDPIGLNWSAPSQLTFNQSVVSTNTGVDVSTGRVTKSFELIPSLALPRASTLLVEAFVLRATAGMQNWSSNSPSGKRVYTVKVENAKKFVTYCMVTIDVQYNSLHKRYFRILNSRTIAQGTGLL